MPGGPVVKIPPLVQGTQVQSLVGELRSHMPQLKSPHAATVELSGATKTTA